MNCPMFFIIQGDINDSTTISKRKDAFTRSSET